MVLTKKTADGKEKGPLEALLENCQSEMEILAREIKEISLMLEQSQLEVTKLAQRNATINAQLQQVQTQFENVPKGDMKAAYDSAFDSQQRIFVMRGQLDKLQSDRAHLERYQDDFGAGDQSPAKRRRHARKGWFWGCRYRRDDHSRPRSRAATPIPANA